MNAPSFDAANVDVRSCQNVEESTDATSLETDLEYVPKIIWHNTIAIVLLHLVTLLTFPFMVCKIKLLSYLWGFVWGYFCAFGVTAGAHRLWSHRTYKAKLPLQIIMLIGYAGAGMNSLFDWVRDHRVHHKFSDTDADPHNANRGFFFSHVGWLMVRKHPEVARKGRTLDFTDVTEDPLLKFYNKYFLIFKIFLCFIFPMVVPVYVWNETWLNAFVSQVLIRYVISLNFIWSVNSVAHTWGQRPYDKRIRPVENLGVAIVAIGEGWHNYHHVFPWDYRASELGNYKFNPTTMALDLFAKIGWAYDMKSPSADLVRKVLEKHGDGSYGTVEISYKEKVV